MIPSGIWITLNSRRWLGGGLAQLLCISAGPCAQRPSQVATAIIDWQELNSVSDWIQRLTGLHKAGWIFVGATCIHYICFSSPYLPAKKSCLKEKFKYFYSNLKRIIIAALGQQFPSSVRPVPLKMYFHSSWNKEKKPCWLLSRIGHSRKYKVLYMIT